MKENQLATRFQPSLAKIWMMKNFDQMRTCW